MTFFNDIGDFFRNLSSLSFRPSDMLDIIFVFLILFYGIRLVRDTRAYQLLKGLVFLLIAFALTSIFQMQASNYIFKSVWQYIIIILIVVFQQEIRQVFANLGRLGDGKLSFKSLFTDISSENRETVKNAIAEICKAVEEMSESKTGALIVMEKNVFLDDIVNNGTVIDAAITSELIGNVFFPNSPLHDGAAIVRNGRLLAARCVLPLTKRTDVSTELGTRHKSAIGMSEQSDAIVVVVSEETGTISVAQSGRIYRDFTELVLREKLLNELAGPDEADESIAKKLLKGKKKDGKSE
jgi:diadenylate cyclase